jgi:amino acid transporter
MVPPAAAARKGFLRPLTLTAVMFFTVSGGPYGLEPLFAYVGGAQALILVLLLPFLWSLPAILVVLELNGLMPVNGGYYLWVKTALGPFWGFLEGWWSWIFTLVDLAIYPVLFLQYLSFFIPDVEPLRIPLSLLIVWLGAGMNLLGIVPVGRSSVALGAAVVAPFFVLYIAGFVHGGPVPLTTAGTSSLPAQAAFAMGMFTVMWNYLGWDNGSPYAGEVHEPVRTYTWSLAAAFLLIVAMYVLAVYTGAVSGMEPSLLEEEGFPSLGTFIGGKWLGGLLSAGGMASTLGLFLSILLSISRIPAAMAEDRFLPEALGRLSSVRQVPYVSILLCALVVSGMVLWSLGELLIIDVTVYSAALFLEFVSLIVLRRKLPDAARPFRIPLGERGLLVMTAVPACCLAVALYGVVFTSDVHTGALLFAGGIVLSGPAAWYARNRLLT